MSEIRPERVPTKAADLERLHQELEQLGHRVKKSNGEDSQNARTNEPAEALVMRGR